MLKLKSSGISESTLENVNYILKKLARNVDLEKPENVKLLIANMQHAKSYKANIVKAYNYLVMLNEMTWNKPKYKPEAKIPLIPTTESINKIISASTKKYATLFTILAETGMEAHELSNVNRDDIDVENGILNAQGCKGHAPRSFKLKRKTKAMLAEYMHKYKGTKPFPTSCHISHTWTRTRNKLADKLQNPDLKRVKMRNLRNYSGAQLYNLTKDVIRVMRHLGHKKLETTMHYIRGIHLNEEEEYTCRSATNAKEATELMEVGFEYVATTPQDLMLFRKRK